jgi:hypothetical protein
MPKRIALKDAVEVDGTDLSDLSRSVSFSSEHSREDVSGFNSTGFNEYLAGQTEQSVTVEFFGSYGTDEVHQTLYPAHKDRSVVEFKWRPDQTAAVGVTNPELRGNVQILTYNPGATRGDVDTYQVEFTAVDEAGLQFYTTAGA